jgi:hypothetical protein
VHSQPRASVHPPTCGASSQPVDDDYERQVSPSADLSFFEVAYVEDHRPSPLANHYRTAYKPPQ